MTKKRISYSVICMILIVVYTIVGVISAYGKALGTERLLKTVTMEQNNKDIFNT